MAFRPDREFSVQRYTGRAWLAAGMARWLGEDERSISRIRLTPELAGRLKRDWFYRQARFTEEDDGSIVMAVPETDPRAILPLMRWLGPDAELLTPEELRERIVEEALKLAERHARLPAAQPARRPRRR
jgi:predicted DNA-binding transcriptional regulator YafY